MASTVVPRLKLGSQGLEVSQQGLGCMGMSAFYGPPAPEQDMIDLIRHAVDRGVTFLDTSDVYGPHTNEVLVGKGIKGIRDKVQLATKFGASMDEQGNFILNEQGKFSIRGDPEHVRAACESSLKRLNVDYIDLYYQHRVDTNVPIEITVGAMKELVQEGKVKYLGLSESSASDIRRAHAVHPITAVQIEWSLWVRDVEEDIIPTCRELGIGIVPYSPLGRGFFAGFKPHEATESDSRKTLERFSEENLEKNEKLRQRVVEIAEKKKCSSNQLALAWVHHKGKDVVPIPGTTKRKNLDSNIDALGVTLTDEEISELEAAVPASDVAGERYYAGDMTSTWRFAQTPPLSSWKH